MSDITPEHARKWIPILAREAADAAENDDLANVLFALTRAMTQADGRIWNEMILVLGGYTENTDSWPDFDDITWDPYDESMELKGCGPAIVFTDEQWARVAGLGFQRTWICYRDGSERYYPGGHYRPAREAS